ncbi:MAG TPA: ABC transporter permease [Chryseolinea sp.]|nr:ABC transporter permease [Chryseolinea sp.]
MIRNYFLVTIRTMLRNKVFSLITVCGFAIAIAAAFLLYQYVQFESGYDDFQNKRLYRVSLKYFKGESVNGGNASNTSAAGPALKQEFPEVLNYARLVKSSLFTSSLTKSVTNALEFSRPLESSLVAFNEEYVYFADARFLDMFDFPLLSGNAETALKEPNSIVITESVARKYFGDEPALGKSLSLNREVSMIVTGVLKNIPENSHLKFDILLSYSTTGSTFDGDNFWGWSVFYTYLELAPGSDPAAFDIKINTFLKKRAPEFADYQEYHTRFALQPVGDIHLRSGLNNEQSPVSDTRTTYFLTLLAVLILFIAWVNYINLSTAKALDRSKEVGLRKVVGATRQQLVLQFLMDALVVNSISALIAGCLVTALWPAFQHLVGKQMPLVLFSSPTVVCVVMLSLMTGVVVIGGYPALLLSSFNPAIVLKGKFLKSSSGATARKAMISFQYFVALLLIAGTVLLYQQLSFLQSQDTGYTKDEIVVVEGPAVYDSATNSKINFLKKSLLEAPGIVNMTSSANIPGQPIIETTGISRMGGNNDEAFGSAMLGVDTSFFSTYGIRLIEGRKFTDHETMNFRRAPEAEMIRLVVNQEFVRRMGLTPQTALNEKVRFWWGPDERNAEIIGIVNDHHQLSLKDPFEAIAYMQPQWTTWKYFSLRMTNKNSAANLSLTRDIFKNIFPDNPFVSYRLNDYYNQQYQADKKLGQLVGIFTGLAIVITCLGLIGLTVFTVSQRTKEIGIRKVLGAPVIRILYLFSHDLIRILMGTYVVAVPVIFFGGQQWLSQFANAVGVGWQVVGLPVLILFVVTLTVVIIISLRRTLESPVKALKYE